MRWGCVKTGPQLGLRQLIPRSLSRFCTVLRIIVRPRFPITDDAEYSADTHTGHINDVTVYAYLDVTRCATGQGLSDKLPMTLTRCTKREMIERDMLKRPVTLC